MYRTTMNDTNQFDLTSLLELPRLTSNSADTFIVNFIRGFYGLFSPLFPNSPIAFILIALWLNLLELTVETGYDLNSPDCEILTGKDFSPDHYFRIFPRPHLQSQMYQAFFPCRRRRWESE
jgi:hypothetical protein